MKITCNKISNVSIHEKYTKGWFGYRVDITSNTEITFNSLKRKAIHLLKKCKGLQKTLAHYGIEVNFADKFGHYTHIGQVHIINNY